MDNCPLLPRINKAWGNILLKIADHRRLDFPFVIHDKVHIKPWTSEDKMISHLPCVWSLVPILRFSTVTMPHLSHSSYLSSEDQNGYCHTISIDPSATERLQDFAIYKGKARSNGGLGDTRDGSIVIAKFTERKGISSHHWAQSELDKAKVAQDAAKVFNNTMRHLSRMQDGGKHSSKSVNSEEMETLNFQIPQVSELASVSFFDSTRLKDESFIILDKLSNFTNFICTKNLSESSNNKKNSKKGKRSKSLSCSENSNQNVQAPILRSRSNSEGDGENSILDNFSTEGNVKDVSNRYLHAFVHYFSAYHNGEKAIDCLRGQFCEKNRYTLTVPVIHSKHRDHGANDEGVEGISRVISNHVCSDLCRHLPPMCHDTVSDAELKWRMQGS